jgi:predicted RND superfamily exporter protein
VGDGFLGLAVAFDARGPAERDATLAAIDAALARTPHPAIRGVRRVGSPFVEAWVERESGRATLHWMPVFGLLVIGITLFLYRSVRALLAILASLAAAVALGVAAGGLLGFTFTVVSALVPLTIMVTALATLVYLHSRYVDQPEGVPLADHQIAALQNKFLPVTASTFAAALGFAALAVSRIRPIRELGIWTATGLVLSWVVAFTLFPALQRALRPPTRRTVATRTIVYDRIAAALPAVTFRWRWPFLVGALALALGGLVALFGVPGRIAPMPVGLDLLEYVDPSLPIHQDMVFFREHVSGLGVARVWVRTPPGAITDPGVLRGLERFSRAVESEPGVSAVIGPTTFLRMRRYLAGQGDALPDDPEAFAALAGDLEQLLLTEPELREFFDLRSLASTQLTVTFRDDQIDYGPLAAELRRTWDRTVWGDPAFHGVEMQVVGEALLQDKVGASLVPTLTESFAITAALILLAFLFVFRSASARLMAMIPSVFAILATFLGMRLLGASLNIATILVATTVLGTTENDQIHFFHHLHEGEGSGGLEAALRHTLRVSGRAIVFATLINAAGFLGLALSSFPPLRQFGVVTASAFLLAMLADFTALPAALWIVRRERPAPPSNVQGQSAPSQLA